jgi:hypothetical protein
MSRNGRRLARYLAAQRGEARQLIRRAHRNSAATRLIQRRIARNAGVLPIGSLS